MKHKSYWNFQVPAFSSVLQEKKKKLQIFPGFVRLHLESQKELEMQEGKVKMTPERCHRYLGRKSGFYPQGHPGFPAFCPHFPIFST